jgi:hypothetical protein
VLQWRISNGYLPVCLDWDQAATALVGRVKKRKPALQALLG